MNSKTEKIENKKITNTNTNTKKECIRKAISVAFFIPVTITCMALTIYFANEIEFGLKLQSLLTFCGLFIVLTAVVLFSIQSLFIFRQNKLPFIISNTILLTFGILLWIQGNVFAWNLGELDGTSIDWHQWHRHGIAEIVFWFCILGVAVLKRQFISHFAVYIACILMLAQLLPTANQIRHSIKHSIHSLAYEITFDGFFDYSQETDVIVVVLDTFGKPIFDIVTKDDNSYQNDIFQDFTCFSQCFVSRPPFTRFSMTRILTGHDTDMPRDASLRKFDKFFTKAFNDPNMLFSALTRAGYRCNAYSWKPSFICWDAACVAPNLVNMRERTLGDNLIPNELCEITLFRMLPIFLKQKCYESFSSINQRVTQPVDLTERYYPLKNLTDSAFFKIMKNTQWKHTPNIKQCKFIHLLGTHTPYCMNEKAEPEILTQQDDLFRQAKGCLYIVKNLLEKLKAVDSYDRSFILIMSDHGADRRSHRLLDESGVHRPLLLVKRPGDRYETMQFNDAPVHLKDTTPAILTELNLPRGKDAFSWFAVPETLAEERKIEWNAYWEKLIKKEVPPPR
ncbi:MAG: sulfatase-like hydrolase/transferase [Planctomycetaceae bacterium]|jgi:hypothetical protein|nr:sulfatase-like hydrolase/transferase [Planctomycetaceae bacterium]